MVFEKIIIHRRNHLLHLVLDVSFILSHILSISLDSSRHLSQDLGPLYFLRKKYFSYAGHEIAPNTGANATKFFTLATKS